MAVLSYLPKLKMCLGLAFSAYFLHDFCMKFLQRKKEEKMEIQKFEYLKNEKNFLDEIKSIFL